ncbi:hypothetical protein HYH03_013493 [Edaphochlamys debaryana]|uniref:Uncharacterized protein n=1 Tax=Edaphochlamys debaryana TaxID=47281 RepID=A0A835XS21_9CHLO|nr:hypothetical protein HYH03_013493 [Edaphochlamys debaryana]|eukprot:KAG2487913.1 hypothetical protein HYH03_013493 [Edaphochlamys debaryana]
MRPPLSRAPLIALLALLAVASAAAEEKSTPTPANLTAVPDFEEVLTRLVINRSRTGEHYGKDQGREVVEVTIATVLDTLQHLLAAPVTLNETFLRVPELVYPHFWELASAARVLGGAEDPPPDGPPGGQDVVTQLENISAKVAKLYKHLCWPVLRRVIIAAIVQRRFSQGPFPPEARPVIARLSVQLYELHKAAAARKGIIDFFHISKAGGTTFCQLAKLNGCRTQSFAARRNCLIREFDDVPRWVNYTLHVGMAPDGLRTPWFANYGTKTRKELSCRMRKRYMLRRRYNIYANEYTLYGGSEYPRATHVCAGSLNVLQMRHPQTRLRSHLMWVWALYDHHFKEQAGAFFPTHNSTHWNALMPAVTDNYYLRSMLGESVYYSPPNHLNETHLHAGRLATLQFDVLMLLEEPGMNDVLYEMAMGWGLGFRAVHARTSTQLHEVGRQGLPDPLDWQALLKANELDLELYRFGSLVALLDSIVFQIAKESGLGTGYASVQDAGADEDDTSQAQAEVVGTRAVNPGDDEQWALPGNGTGPARVCGYVATFDHDRVLPPWVIV